MQTFFFWIALFSVPLAAEPPKRIAITFDDAPRPAGPLMGMEERTSLLIESLERGGVEGAMFFVTTSNLDELGDDGAARLRRYTEAGHVIGNHSHGHGSANRMTAEDFLADVALAKYKLATFANNSPFFRFPFLHEGDSPEKRDSVRAGLLELELKQGYVTVDNYDWFLQALLDEAVRAKKALDLDAWRATYIEVLGAAISHYDRMAVEVLGRSPAHVLLLHENDLAALFIADLVAALRAEGWHIVPALEAYTDPIAESEPDTMILSQGRVAALAAISGRATESLRHPLESESALRKLLEERGMIDAAE